MYLFIMHQIFVHDYSGRSKVECNMALGTRSSGLRWGDIFTVQYNSVRGGQKEELGQGRILREGIACRMVRLKRR